MKIGGVVVTQYLCVLLKLYQVSFNSNEKQKSFFNDTFNWRSVHEGQVNLALVWFKK